MHGSGRPWPVVLFLLCSLAVATLWNHPFVLTAVTIGISAALLAITKRTSDVVLYTVMVLVGFIGEAIFVHLGVWSYPRPQLLGMPYWIPFLWGIVALAITYTEREISTVFNGDR